MVNRQDIDRPSWDDYFMALAFLVATRSEDAETQHGCVIVSQDNHVLSTGYNGFPRGIDTSDLPNLRPDKYPWMCHSERNALAFCKTRPEKGKVYVTGECCLDCIWQMYQSGIEEINMYDGHGSHKINDETRQIIEIFEKKAIIRFRKITPNFDFISKIDKFPYREQ